MLYKILCAVLPLGLASRHRGRSSYDTQYIANAEAGHNETAPLQKGLISVMTFNVEEFFEPCMQHFSLGKAFKGTVKEFSEAHPGLVEDAYLLDNPSAPADYNVCRHMTDAVWDQGVVAVRGLLAAHRPDVVLLQEFAISRLDVAPAGYKVVADASSGEEGWKDARLANAILVKDTFVVESTFSFNLASAKEATPRECACAHLRGPPPECLRFFTCSVHLTGGRFDDDKWQVFPTERVQELEALLSVVTNVRTQAHRKPPHKGKKATWPLIIAGDFNAMLSPEVAGSSMSTHPKYQQALQDGNADKFLEYATCGHSFLHEHGFRSVYYPESEMAQSFIDEYVDDDREAVYRVPASSKFGGLVDWVYVSESVGIDATHQPIVTHAIADGISDHNAVQVWLQVDGECY